MEREERGIQYKLLGYNIRVRKGVSNTCRNLTDNPTACGIVVSNLLSCIRKNQVLMYSRDNTRKKRSDEWYKLYNNKKIKNNDVIKVIDKLENLGYIVNHIGYRIMVLGDWINYPSYITPTQKFIDVFCKREESMKEAEKDYIDQIQTIVVRDSNKNDIEYVDSADVKRMRNIVHKLNEVNSMFVFTAHDGSALDNSKIVRIFNESFSRGGRFYKHDALMIKNKEIIDGKFVVKPVHETRLGMKINGEEVVEVDFSSLHPSLLYDIEGIDKAVLCGDVYSGMISPDKLSNPANRALFKLAVNTMLNATSEQKAIQAINSDINKGQGVYDYKSGKEVVGLIKGAMTGIAEHFCRAECTGLRLQYLESQIMEGVIQHFVKQDKPIVPVHDSAIVRRQDLEDLLYSMAENYRKLVDKECDVEYWADCIDVYMTIHFANGEDVSYVG